MIKSIQLKIIIVFFLIGIITITGLGAVYIHSINALEMNIGTNEIGNITELENHIQQMIHTMED